MPRLDIGLIGLGRLGRVYARDLAGRIPDTRLVAVADTAGTLARDVAAEFEVPARCPTMPCFGGPDGRTLYLTSARQGRPADELRAFPHSGCVFAAQVDVPGLPTNFFIPSPQ